MKLSIIIPAYNERERIRPMLDSYLALFIAQYAENVEFVVVVNGSNDGTEDVVGAYIERFVQVKMVVIEKPIGKGGAIRRGLSEASGDWVGFVDADGSTPAEAYLDLVNHQADGDVLLASRWLPESIIPHRQPWQRRFLSRMFNLLVRLLFNLHLRDTQCGAKLMSREVLDAILPRLGATHWIIDVDILLQAKRMGAKLVEIPTVWNDQPGSKLDVKWKTMRNVLLALLRLRFFYSPFRPVVRWLDQKVGRHIYEEWIRSGSLIRQGRS